MRNRGILSIAFLLGALVFSPLLLSAQTMGEAAPPADKSFDPHDLTGPWIGNFWHAQVGPGRGPGGLQDYASYDQRNPEPPLTDWGKKNLLYKSISHDSLAGTHTPGWDRPGHYCPSIQEPCYSADQNGVPVNDLNGEYPAKDCEPLSVPAIYDYPQLGEFEFVTTADKTRMYMLFEYHHEWRTFWLQRDHPKDVYDDLTYEGDSVAHWEGNTFVVDTVGFNGKTMISQSVGHSKSTKFHLIERFTRVDKDNLEIDMTYIDPLAWGDKEWTGFKKYYHKAPKEEFREFICSPREYKSYEEGVIAPETDSLKAIGK
jgi:hypothetical protein